jgi:hypothetical protein
VAAENLETPMKYGSKDDQFSFQLIKLKDLEEPCKTPITSTDTIEIQFRKAVKRKKSNFVT